MQTIKPAKGTIFAQPIEREVQTKSGILLGGAASERPEIARVINSGSEQYKSGDEIVYKPYTTTEIKLNGTEFFLVDVHDVLGVVLEVEDE